MSTKNRFPGGWKNLILPLLMFPLLIVARNFIPGVKKEYKPQATVSATWSLLSTPEATQVSEQLQAYDQKLGSKVIGVAYGSRYGTPDNGNQTEPIWQRVATEGLGLYDPESYVEYAVAAKDNKVLTINEIKVAIVGGGTGNARVSAKYSVDDFATSSFIATEDNKAYYNNTRYLASTNTGGDEGNPVVLINGGSGIPVLNGQEYLTFKDLSIEVPAGKTFRVRLYVYLRAEGGTRHIGQHDATITGTIEDGGTPQPKITTTGSLSAFTQSSGPSATQTYKVSAINLTDALTITPPDNYEISADGGTSWATSAAPLTIQPSSGSVSETTITVRLNAEADGIYSGNIVHASTGANPVNVAVSGQRGSGGPATWDAIVAKDGTGNYTTVQAAIDAAPSGRTTPYVIYIKDGVYKEIVTIPSNKPFIHLIGESVANTIITYDNFSGKPNPAGGTYGTSNSATVFVNGNDFLAMNITFENSTGDSPQALAINVNSDRAVFKNCRFLGGQDTVLANGTAKRQYFRNCYIEGTVDFIFGDATAVFEECIIYAKDRQDKVSGSYITAANTKAGQTYGYVFRNCVIPNNRGVTTYTLGRPWQNDGSSATPSESKVVFLNTIMENTVKPEGWSVWSSGTNTAIITYAEYQSKKYDGSPVDVSQRPAWTKQLTAEEAAQYTNANIFAGWDPCSTGACGAFTPDLVISGFRAVKGTSTTEITWNLSWPMPGATMEVFRSTDGENFTSLRTFTANTEKDHAFGFTENNPAPGTSYYYYVVGSKSGMLSHFSDTVLISSVPTISATEITGGFLQGGGVPSAPQKYKVSAVNLLDALTITPPAGYEISDDNGTSWKNSSSSITIQPDAQGRVPETEISVRLNAATAGTWEGEIVHASNGAAEVRVAVTGTSQEEALRVSEVLLLWPMSADNSDDADSRAEGVEPSTTTLNKLYLTGGYNSRGVVPYSTETGQALGAVPPVDAATDGLWTDPGPGGSVNRTVYEEFTITAAAGYSVRVDSFIVSSGVLLSANGRLAMVYSRSDFSNDSTEVAGATWASPLVLPAQHTSGLFDYRMALNGAEGITLMPGEKLTLRIYPAVGSGSPERFLFVKDAAFKGFASKVSGGTENFTATWSLLDDQNPTSVPDGVNVAPQRLGARVTGISYKTGYGTAGTPNETPRIWQRVGTEGIGLYDADSYIEYAVSSKDSRPLQINSFSVAIVGGGSGNARLAAKYSLDDFATSAFVATESNKAVYNEQAWLAATETGGDQGEPVVLINGGSGIPVLTGQEVLTFNILSINVPAGQTFRIRLYVYLRAEGGTRHIGQHDATITGKLIGGDGPVEPDPAIELSGILNAFTQNLGTPSAEQTYSVSGTDLKGDLTITPPTGYEISADGGTTWKTNSSPLVITPNNGTISSTQIRVRLNAAAPGAHNGTILHTSPDAQQKTLFVTGNVTVQSTLTVTAALPEFTQTVGTPSAAASYTVQATGLTGPVQIIPPAGFEISTNNGTTWVGNAGTSVNHTNGTLAETTILVRLNAAAGGVYIGNIVHSTPGATAVPIFVKGTAEEDIVPPPPPPPPPPAVLEVEGGSIREFTQTIGYASPSQTFVVRGENLQNDVTVTCPAGYEMSTNFYNWQNSSVPIVLKPIGGTLHAQTIYVRLKAAAAGSYNGVIRVQVNQNLSREIAVSGKTVGVFSVFPNPARSIVNIPHPQLYTSETINIYSMSGIKLITKPTLSRSSYTPVDISGLPAGMYRVEYKRRNEKSVWTTIIKQ